MSVDVDVAKIVHPPCGALRGTTEFGVGVWRGAPYAEQPVGERRFTGARAAAAMARRARRPRTRADSAARQVVVGRGRDDPKVRDEACLTLTVWSPDTAASLPVMVWIPGGAFVLGAGQFQLYNGARLAANGDVVVVNVTYRIGVFGGLELSSLGDGFDDNLALRDQIAALQWVRDNVSAFGGDPRRVTVFGESAGATSVLALLASPAADGLFGRAIAQSPALPLIADRELRARRAEEFVRELDVGVADIKGLPQRQLRLAAARLQERSAASTPTLAYGLTYGVDLLPRHPTDAARAGEITRLPLIVGTNSHEATMFAWSKPPMLPTTPALVDDYFRRVAPDAKDRVLAAYPGYPRRRAAIEVASDVMFGGTGLGVRGRVQRRRADVRVPLRPRGGEPAGAEARRHARQRDRARAPHLRLVSGPADPSARPADPARGGSAHAAGVVGLRRRSRWPATSNPAAPSDDWPRYELPRRATRVIKSTRDVVVDDPDRLRREAWANLH